MGNILKLHMLNSKENKMKTLILLSLIALTGCTSVKWYVYDDKGKMTQKNPIFIDYAHNCVQFENTDASLYKGAVYMEEKVHVTELTELTKAVTYNLCGYEITAK